MMFCPDPFRFTHLSTCLAVQHLFFNYLISQLDESFLFSFFILWAPFLSFNFQHVFLKRPSSVHTALPPSLCSKASKINLLFIKGKNISSLRSCLLSLVPQQQEAERNCCGDVAISSSNDSSAFTYYTCYFSTSRV